MFYVFQMRNSSFKIKYLFKYYRYRRPQSLIKTFVKRVKRESLTIITNCIIRHNIREVMCQHHVFKVKRNTTHLVVYLQRNALPLTYAYIDNTYVYINVRKPGLASLKLDSLSLSRFSPPGVNHLNLCTGPGKLRIM
jgi:hypothetical protein